MKLDIGAHQRYSAVMDALQHLVRGDEVRKRFAGRHFEGVHGDQISASLRPAEFEQLHLRVRSLFDHFREQRRRQYVIDCLSNDRRVPELPADIAGSDRNIAGVLQDHNQRRALAREVIPGLLAQIEDANRSAPDPRVVALELKITREALSGIRDVLGTRQQRLVDLVLGSIAELGKLVDTAGLGYVDELKRFRVEHVREIYGALRQVMVDKSLKKPGQQANPSFIGLLRAVERYQSGETSLQTFIKTVGERVRAIESSAEARGLLMLASRAVKFFPDSERMPQIKAVLEATAARIKKRQAGFEALIGGKARPEDLKFAAGVRQILGTREAVQMLRAYPKVFGMSLADREAYLNRLGSFLRELPAGLRDEFSFSRRGHLYSSLDAVTTGVSEAKAEISAGKYAAIFYKDGLGILAEFFKARGISHPDWAAQVLAILSSTDQSKKAKEIRDLVTSRASVSDITRILDAFCENGWAKRYEGGFKFGAFPTSVMGPGVANAFGNVKGQFVAPLQAGAVASRTDVKSTMVVEVAKIIGALEEFLRVSCTEVVDLYVSIWNGLDKVRRPGASGCYVRWRQRDFNLIQRTARPLLSKISSFRMPEPTTLVLGDGDRAFFTAVNNCWRSILAEHGDRFCMTFAESLQDASNKQLIEDYKTHFGRLVATFRVIQKALAADPEVNIEQLRKLSGRFVDQEFFAALVTSLENKGADGQKC